MTDYNTMTDAKLFNLHDLFKLERDEHKAAADAYERKRYEVYRALWNRRAYGVLLDEEKLAEIERSGRD